MSEVLVRTEGTLGRITLNRPRAINALTLDMVRTIDAALSAWENDAAVCAVLLDGEGERGLCAGGDIRALYDAALAGDLAVPQAFFGAEYRLNARIARYAKPYVAFMDGIVMGGGIGLSSHGAVRIVTERSRLAMPETGIGFMPDVGGTWLLGRAPDGFGIHAALTAGQMGAADAIACGLADLCVPSSVLAELAADLASCETAASMRACVEGHACAPPPGIFAGAASWSAACYDSDSVEDIIAALAERDAPACRQASEEIGRKSPVSLKVTLRALREAPGLGSLEACLEREYRLVLAFMSSHDFREGVRAAVVDKDRAPAWSPATLEGVTPAMVESFFTAPDFGGLGLARAS